MCDPTALRTAKTLLSFDRSECNRLGAIDLETAKMINLGYRTSLSIIGRFWPQ